MLYMFNWAAQSIGVSYLIPRVHVVLVGSGKPAMQGMVYWDEPE